MKKNVLVLILFTCAFGLKSFAQLSVSYYSSSFSKAAVAYNFNGKLWTELRVYSNTLIDDFTPELVLCYNVVNTEKHNVYIGVGANANYYNGLVLPMGVQFTPFEKLNNFSLHIEIQPCYDFEGEIILQSAWGLRYSFGK